MIKNHILKISSTQATLKLAKYLTCTYFLTEAVARRCFVNKVFLEIPKNSQENTYARPANFAQFCEYSAVQKKNLSQTMVKCLENTCERVHS